MVPHASSDSGHTHGVATHVSYGPNVPHDGELRLCGDVGGKRALELGIATEVNALALAGAGAKAMAVDPSAERIASGRTMAESEGVRIEFHQGDLGDLGFATSGSVDLVVAAGSLDGVDDLPRVLRQVHRILKPEHALVDRRSATRSQPCSTGPKSCSAALRSGAEPERERALHRPAPDELPRRRHARAVRRRPDRTRWCRRRLIIRARKLGV